MLSREAGNNKSKWNLSTGDLLESLGNRHPYPIPYRSIPLVILMVSELTSMLEEDAGFGAGDCYGCPAFRARMNDDAVVSSPLW